MAGARSPSRQIPPMPAWVTRQLAQAGVITQGFTRRARPTTCKVCGQVIVTGWTEEPCAVLARVDPAPLSNLGEWAALLAGRATYDLARRAGRYELDLRELDHIAGSPPESPDTWRARGDVVATHHCNAPRLPMIESRLP